MITSEWEKPFRKLIKKYGNRAHPLEYGNIYQLLVMVVLSAQDSDANINRVAPALFEQFPNMESLAASNADAVIPFVSKVRGHCKKVAWLLDIASTVKSDAGIPLDMDGLVKLKGIGRKSANVIMREAGAKPQGIMVDLHVLRVIARVGISSAETGDKMEQDLMDSFPKSMWKDLGMSVSYLGREICRPTNPHHDECVMNKVCCFCLEKSQAIRPST